MAGERSLGSLVYWFRAKNEELKRKADESGKAIQDMSKKFDESKKHVKSWSTQVKSSLQQVSDFAKRNKEAIQAVAIGGGAALAALTLEIRKATKENVEFTNALIGLRSIAEGTGQDINKVTEAAEALADDGLMSVADAATGLKNLLLAGFGLDEAVVLMERFKDSAAFGRQGALSFGQAIVSATEGVKNGNSILVDNAGVTKNLSVMLQEAGYSAQDLMHAADDAGIRMAIFNGIVNETRHQVGDAAKLADELGGALSRTEESARKVHRSLGAAVEGPLREMLNIIQPILERTADWIERNKELVGAIITITTAVTALTAGGAAWLLLIPKISSALNLLAKGPVGWTILGLTALVTAFVTVKNAMQKAREEQEKFIERTRDLADKMGYRAREINTLVDEYDRLQAKTTRTKEEQEKLNEVVAEIGEIAPEAITQWDDLGRAIEINAGKARQAAKEMLEARKSLLETALARAEVETPQLQMVVKRDEEKVREASGRLRKATEEYNKAVALQAKAYEIYRRVQQGESLEDVFEDAKKAGLLTDWARPDDVPTQLGIWMHTAVAKAEKEVTEATKYIEKVGKEYFDAQDKLAELEANQRELAAILIQLEQDPYAGLKPLGGTGGGTGGTGGTAYDPSELLSQLEKELKLIDDLAELFGDTSNVAKDKANALRAAVVELASHGIDPTKTAMGNLVEQYQGYARETEEAKKETYDLFEAKQELLKALADVDQKANVFGETLDTGRERLNLFRDAIVQALVNKEPIENIQDLIDEYNALKKEIDDATTAEQNNKAATDMLTQAQEYLYRMTGKVVPEWERFAQKLEEMAGKEGVLPETAAQLREIADLIRQEGAETDFDNWFVRAFEKIGYAIEDAQQIFESFRNSLIDGFTDIITKGEDVADVFKRILDYLAEMIIKKGIVEPFVDWLLGGIDLGGGGGEAHIGALVTPVGLVHDLPDYHGGGKIPGLRSDERVIKVLTGERVLSRAQNVAYEAGWKPQVKIDITNNTGTPIQAEPEVSFDGAEMVVSLLLEGHRRNIGGIQKLLPFRR